MEVHIPYTQFTLSNGLNVIVHRDASLPVVSVNVWYHVGSKNEKPGRTGFAHLFEHIMFEGSAHVPEGDFDNHLEAVGGVNNGSTTNDRTNYWENVPSNALELALWLEADRMGFLLETMDESKLDIQRAVVMNERREAVENRPYGRAFETVYAHLYGEGHPYGWPVLGTMEDLSTATLEDVTDFFRTYYTPGNASIAIAGDVSERTVRRLVQRYFGDFAAGPPVPEVVVPPVTLDGPRMDTLEDAVQLPRLYVAWHAPEMFTEDDAAMDVLASVLTAGKSSRLHRRLVYEERIAHDVQAFQNGQERAGSFWIIATALPGGPLAPIAAIIREELELLVSTGVEAAELERAVAGIETSFVRALDRVGGFGGKADRLNHYHFFAGTPGWARRDLLRYLLSQPGVWLSVVPRGRTDLAVSAPPGGADP